MPTSIPQDVQKYPFKVSAIRAFAAACIISLFGGMFLIASVATP